MMEHTFIIWQYPFKRNSSILHLNCRKMKFSKKRNALFRLFLCKSGDGFNFTTSRRIGYPWLLEFLAGDVYNKSDSGI